jgi:hypothetical protein
MRISGVAYAGNISFINSVLCLSNSSSKLITDSSPYPSLPETTETTETELAPTLEYVSPVSSVSLSGYGEESIEEILGRNQEAMGEVIKSAGL